MAIESKEGRLAKKGPPCLLDCETEYSNDRLEEYRDAKAAGFVVVFPKSNELFIDIDTEDAWKEFTNRLRAARSCNSFRYRSLDETVSISKSGLPCRHVRIKIRDYLGCNIVLTEAERIMLQLFFCSDPYREMMNTLRLIRTGTSKSCFFEVNNSL